MWCLDYALGHIPRRLGSRLALGNTRRICHHLDQEQSHLHLPRTILCALYLSLVVHAPMSDCREHCLIEAVSMMMFVAVAGRCCSTPVELLLIFLACLGVVGRSPDLPIPLQNSGQNLFRVR